MMMLAPKRSALEAAAGKPRPATASDVTDIGDSASDSDSDSDLTAYISGKDSDLTAADVDTSDSDHSLIPGTQKCPISGTEGAGCPMSTFIGFQKPKAKTQAKVGDESGFMAGKSPIAAVEKAPSSHDRWLTKLCPLHWDRATAKPKRKAMVGAESGFMAGKSLIAAVEKAPSPDDGWLTKLCPLHWDDATVQAFMITAVVSSLSGVAVVGFALHRCRRS